MATLKCPHCRGSVQFDPALAGQVVACPHCNKQFQMLEVAKLPSSSQPTRKRESGSASRSVPHAGGSGLGNVEIPPPAIRPITSKYAYRTKKPNSTAPYLVGALAVAFLAASIAIIFMHTEGVAPALREGQERRRTQAKPVAFDFQGMKVGDPNTKTSEFITLAGKRVFVSYENIDSRFISVSMLFDSNFFADLVEAYAAKFGSPPHRTTEEEVTTGMGVKHRNITVEWDTDSGVFAIMRYGSRVDRGYAILKSPQLREHQERKRQLKQKKLQESL